MCEFRRHIKGLSLVHNNIENIPARFFSELKSLRYLRLDDNSISSLQPEAFRGLEESLRVLELNSNAMVEVRLSLVNTVLLSSRGKQHLQLLGDIADNRFRLLRHNTVPWSVCQIVCHVRALCSNGRRYRQDFLCTRQPMPLGDRDKIWLTSVTPPSQILPQSAPPPADLSVGDIRRRIIAAEWLAMAQCSQWRESL